MFVIASQQKLEFQICPCKRMLNMTAPIHLPSNVLSLKQQQQQQKPREKK